MLKKNKIDSEKILDMFIPYDGNYRHYTEDDVLSAIKEACSQTVDLCARNLIDGIELDDKNLLMYYNNVLKTKGDII